MWILQELCWFCALFLQVLELLLKMRSAEKEKSKQKEWISGDKVELSTEVEILSSQTQIQDSGAQALYHVTCQNSKELFNKLRYW